MGRILIVDDDPSFRASLAETLVSLGQCVVEAEDGDEALERLADEAVDLILLDLRMPGRDGLDVLRALKQDDTMAAIPVALLTAFAAEENTIDAMKLGAFDHLAKPIGRADLADLLQRTLLDVPAPRRPVRRADDEQPLMIGASPAMRAVQKLVGIAASSDATVLIQGETGTGKELVARAIHAHSDRGQASRPFVAINCAAIPADLLESELFGHERGAFSGATHSRPGRFREADGGTLLLDEIGDMSLAMQGKLLRVLQDRRITPVGGSQSLRVDVRLLAATHRDLVAMVRRGVFREDLFYRLNVLRIVIPPLRERGSDVLTLAERFVERFSPNPKRFTPDVVAALLAHPWPGNVRELENTMQKLALVVRGSVIGRDDLDFGEPLSPVADEAAIPAEWLTLDFAPAVARFEKLLLERALVAARDNRAEAARRLGIHRQLLYAKLKEHGLG